MNTHRFPLRLAVSLDYHHPGSGSTTENGQFIGTGRTDSNLAAGSFNYNDH